MNPLFPADAFAAVFVNEVDSGFSFQYLNSKTVNVTSMSPRAISSAISGTVVLQLWGVPPSALVSIAFGARTCLINNMSYDACFTTLGCSLVRAPPLPLPQTPVPPTVSIDPWGYAWDGAFALDTGFRVDSMSVSAGSLLGGTAVTFTGVGFSAITYQDNIDFEDGIATATVASAIIPSIPPSFILAPPYFSVSCRQLAV